MSRRNVNRQLQEVRAAPGPSPPPGLAPLQAQETRSRQLLSTESPAPTPCPRGPSRPPSQMSDLSLAVSSVPHPGCRSEVGLGVVMDADPQAGLAPPGLLGEGGKWLGTWWLSQKMPCLYSLLQMQPRGDGPGLRGERLGRQAPEPCMPHCPCPHPQGYREPAFSGASVTPRSCNPVDWTEKPGNRKASSSASWHRVPWALGSPGAGASLRGSDCQE